MPPRTSWAPARAALRRIGLTALLVGFVLAACGRQAGPSDVSISNVAATSSTSFLLTFSQPVGENADDPSSYRIRDAQGNVLAVLGAHPAEDDRSIVVLTTEPQSAVPYTVEARGLTLLTTGRTVDVIAASGPVRGSTTAAPHVASAMALDPTTLLVTFGDSSNEDGASMSDDALDPASYDVRAPDLTIEAVAFAEGGVDRRRVLITTSAMAAQDYRIALGPIASSDGRPLDPARSEARFTGISLDDRKAPALVAAYALSNTTVRVTFDEPVQASAEDPSKFIIVDATSGSLPVASVDLQEFGTRVTLTTAPLNPETTYTLTTIGIVDSAGNELPADASLTFRGAIDGEDTTPPRVTGATSTGSTRVLVTFSEPVRGGPNDAENVDHYDIVGSATLAGALSPQAIVDVTAATLSGDARSVVLTTLGQSEIAYTLRVVGVRDLAGNTMAGVDRDNPFEIEFFGTAGDATDCDEDGLSDAEEQRGWFVSIVEADGSESRREVTSLPCNPDSDGDGLGDADEKRYRTDPRLPDSDADGLTDDRELNAIYSEPTRVDTDDDGLPDGLEVDFFTTDPLYPDTDGDQFLDGYEVTTGNRNPRIADLPVVEIDVGAIDLQLDVRFDETSSRGTTTVDTTSVSTTLERSRTSSQERVNSNTFEGFFSAYATGCFGGACSSGGDTLANWGISGTVGGGFNTSETWTNTTASAEATLDAYARSLTTEAEASAETTINRIVEGAAMAVEVSITNPGNVAYTVRDIEITALVQNGRNAAALVPVATLFAPSNSAISVGPLNPTRGPFRFVAEGVYPNLVEQLMQNPRGIVFRVANYTLEDEAGRRFAFVQQDVVDRTAGLEIDYAGNEPGESYRVATNSSFDASGATVGLTMAGVLEDVLGLSYVPAAQDELLDPSVFDDAELLDTSYSTRIVDEVEVLYRIRGVSSALQDVDREWWVFTSEDGLINPVAGNPGRDFRTVTVLSETSFVFKFVQDLDGDGIEKAVESIYGSIDSSTDTDADPDSPDSVDTDDDGIPDGDEPFGPPDGNSREPWTIRLDDGRDAYQTSSNPARPDTDFDGLTDCQELGSSIELAATDGSVGPPDCSRIEIYLDGDGRPTLEATTSSPEWTLILPDPTDPASIDTDGDGLTDLEEVLGFRYVGLDATTIDLRPSNTLPATNPLSRDTDEDGLADRLELQLRSDPTTNDGDTVIDQDGDGLVNLQETTGWTVTWVENGATQTITSTSLPSDPDSDDDGLTDWEEYHGCRDLNGDRSCDDDVRFGATDPSNADTDGDGLTDREEVEGVVFPRDGTRRFTDPRDDDSDDDGRRDGEELRQSWSVNVTGRGGYTVWSDPLISDADGDGLNDSAELATGTDPAKADSDEDGALDGLEIARGAVNTDPLTPDHFVTVTYLAVQAGKGSELPTADGDGGSSDSPEDTGAGDFWFRMGVLRPFTENDSTLLEPDLFATSSAVDLPPCTALSGNPDNPDLTGCKRLFGSILGGQRTILQIEAPLEVWINLSGSFALPFTSAFALTGAVEELDFCDGTNVTEVCSEYTLSFGGLTDDASVFQAGALTKGTFTESFAQDVAADGSGPGYRVDVTVQVTVE